MKLLSRHVSIICDACFSRSAHLIAALLIIAVLPCHLSAGEEKIASITFQGNETRESASLTPLLKSKVGDDFSPEKANEDIKTIYNLGLY